MGKLCSGDGLDVSHSNVRSVERNQIKTKGEMKHGKNSVFFY